MFRFWCECLGVVCVWGVFGWLWFVLVLWWVRVGGLVWLECSVDTRAYKFCS